MPTNTSLIDLSAACEQVARDATASVVQVHGRRRPASGIVIAPERVVTTSHSVEWEDQTRVRTADGRLLAAQVAGRDAQLDLVLLRVPTLEGHALTVVVLGAAGLGWYGWAAARGSTARSASMWASTPASPAARCSSPMGGWQASPRPAS